MECIEIAFGLSRDYVPHCAAVIASIIAHHEENMIRFHLISPDIDLDTQNQLKAWINSFNGKTVFFHSFDESSILNFPQGTVFSNVAAYYRLFLPTLLPHVEKILYLDCDIIVNGKLTDLWSTDISDFALAAIRDFNNDNIKIYNRLKYSLAEGYANSGVMLINMNVWRDANVLQKAIELVASDAYQLTYHDQDIINILFHGSIKFVDLKYNVQETFYYTEDWLNMDRKYYPEIVSACNNPVIIHYCVPFKPWHIENIHPLKNQYEKYRKMTPWPDYLLTQKKKISIRDRVANYLKKLLNLLGLYKYKELVVLRQDINKISQY